MGVLRFVAWLCLWLSACDGSDTVEEISGSGGQTGTPCAPPEVPSASGCILPGVPVDGCAAGFEHDGDYGCVAVMPPRECAKGTMALPGETACRPVSSCFDADFAGLPSEADTIFVDASYGGGDSDGTQARPFTTIGAAITAAASGAIVAVGAGSYAEDVRVDGKAVRIWGRCAELVEVQGISQPAAVFILDSAADGTEIHRIAATGPESGIAATGASGVKIEEVWVHDTGRVGIGAADSLGPGDVTVASSLVEAATGAGILGVGGMLSVERTVVRGTRPDSQGTQGRGIEVDRSYYTLADANGSVSQSVIERNTDVGINTIGATLVIDSTLVRDTLVSPLEQESGRGINVQAVRFEGETVSVRGLVTVIQSVIERNVEAGILSIAGDAIVDRTTIRHTDLRPIDRMFGRGVAAQGLLWEGDPVIERGSIDMRASLVEDSYDVGVFLADSDGVIDASAVRNVYARPETKLFGDALSLVGETGTSPSRVHSTLLQNGERAGVSLFARSLELSYASLDCNPIQLNGEGAFELTDAGGNVCGCEGTFTPCQVLSSGLEPPNAIEQ